MRRVHEERGEGPGGSGGGRDAAAKTKQLGLYDQAPEKELEEAQREKAGWDGDMTSWVYPGSRFSTRIHGGQFSR